MRYKNHLKISAITPQLKLGVPNYNAQKISTQMELAYKDGVDLLVTPFMSLTGSTSGDLMHQPVFIQAVNSALNEIISTSKTCPWLTTVIGLPVINQERLLHLTVLIQNGEIIGSNCSNNKDIKMIKIGSDIVLCDDMIYRIELPEEQYYNLKILPLENDFNNFIRTAVTNITADIIVSPAAIPINSAGKSAEDFCASFSNTMQAIHVFANAGSYESTNDLLFRGEAIIANNGKVIAEAVQSALPQSATSSESKKTAKTLADVTALANFQDLRYLRQKSLATTDINNEITGIIDTTDYFKSIDEANSHGDFIMDIDPRPFTLAENAFGGNFQDYIANQGLAIAMRLQHINAKTAVLGISGGLDSTLALLATAAAFDLLGTSKKNILCLTMPGFGTSNRTYNNTHKLIEAVGGKLIEVNIKKAVEQHFDDINLDASKHDVTFENSQARERTQVLMDVANMHNGLVIGTGDLSELALGWCTFNGDHMSMYSVNGSITKTLIRQIIAYVADNSADRKLAEVLQSILSTPVSPELLPPDQDGQIRQLTEDSTGPYDLHDFFLYHTLKFGREPKELFFYACQAFSPEAVDKYKNEALNNINNQASALARIDLINSLQPFTSDVIKHWLKIFYQRFFQQQFKRSCMPDGAKIGEFSLSPRGDWQMPSDLSPTIWLENLESL